MARYRLINRRYVEGEWAGVTFRPQIVDGVWVGVAETDELPDGLPKVIEVEDREPPKPAKKGKAE